MAEITRDMFPPNMMHRIQTPITGRAVVGDLFVTRERPWGGMLYPEPQQSPTTRRRGLWRKRNG